MWQVNDDECSRGSDKYSDEFEDAEQNDSENDHQFDSKATTVIRPEISSFVSSYDIIDPADDEKYGFYSKSSESVKSKVTQVDLGSPTKSPRSSMKADHRNEQSFESPSKSKNDEKGIDQFFGSPAKSPNLKTANTEVDNERRVDELLKKYGLITKTRKLKPKKMVSPKNNATTSATHSPKNHSSSSNDSLRADHKKDGELNTNKKSENHRKLVPSKSNVVVGKIRAKDRETLSDFQHEVNSRKDVAVALKNRVLELENREKALIEAVDELCAQNEELITRLKSSMETELHLEAM